MILLIQRMISWCPPECPAEPASSADSDCEPAEEVPGCNCPPNPAKYLRRLWKIQEKIMCAPATRVVVALLACRALLQTLGVKVCFMNSM
ncbi:hypothetical protein FJT64_023441 [Amphibalanus amphitrite]|uniref:Uncharacterized protein n=1 Tax=Amphibalanus amphitrite TaxID=1232801 RepID=A0A6A4WRT1_AMPAM|nr:hypothetical protein FJT64_023441 [Amphibalanus amphitrite]